MSSSVACGSMRLALESAAVASKALPLPLVFLALPLSPSRLYSVALRRWSRSRLRATPSLRRLRLGCTPLPCTQNHGHRSSTAAASFRGPFIIKRASAWGERVPAPETQQPYVRNNEKKNGASQKKMTMIRLYNLQRRKCTWTIQEYPPDY